MCAKVMNPLIIVNDPQTRFILLYLTLAQLTTCMKKRTERMKRFFGRLQKQITLSPSLFLTFVHVIHFDDI